MRLYFMPGTCSLAVHIALREAAIPFELVRVDTKSGRTERGTDYREVNPKGYVPALELDDGQIITEAAVILQYVADKAPSAQLAPPAGTMDRYRLLEWLNYVATELHKGMSLLFNPKAAPEQQQVAKENFEAKLSFVAARLAGKSFISGDRFSVADAYLFTVLSWTRMVGVDLGRWPELKGYLGRIRSRPSVEAALKAEGLIQG